MDASRFDQLSRSIGTQRRTVLGGLLAGVLLPREASARKKGKGKDEQRKRKGKDRDKGKDKQRTRAQAEVCWRAGACIPKKGANVSQCNLAGYTAPADLNCTGCNLSRANLRDADLSGVNFTRANLSGACLVDADFTGATFANSTNLYNAFFCRTTMPDGSVNNSGCGSGTACCPTCIAAGAACGTGIGGTCCGTSQCRNGACSSCTPTTCAAQGKNCGQIADGCGTTLQCGDCNPPQTCGGGNPGMANVCGCTPATCQSLGKSCGEWPDGCGQMLQCGGCGARQICDNGATCQTCTVCASGCAFNSIQQAIDRSPSPSTLYICPGTYTRGSTFAPIAAIERSYTLVGAGTGTGGTILTGGGIVSRFPVVQVLGVATAELRDLTVTGGNSASEQGAGGGIFASRNATLTLTRVLVTDNTATSSGGGIYNDGTLILNVGSSISGNSPDQCVDNAGAGCP